MTKKRKNTAGARGEVAPSKRDPQKIRKAMESCATFGLLLVAAAIAVPFANLTSGAWLSACKWIYAAGALIFTVARIANVRDPRESFRLRRLRRLEAWAGIALCVGAFFWFYNESRFGAYFGFSLTVLRETIMFTLVGAIIQIIAVWLIYYREKKEQESSK